MKKLIIAAAALAVGVVAQASTVAWGLNNVVSVNGSALDSGSVYVFFVQGNSKADTSAWADISDKAGLTAALAGATYDYTVASGAAGNFSKSAMALSDVGVQPSTKYSVYAVILDTIGVTDDSNFFVTAATAASTTFSDASALSKSYSLSAAASATASNWQSVPEPTSGLLMLLGLAGLALKRKRA